MHNIICRRIHKQLLQWDFRETNLLHDSDGRLQCSNREKNKPCGNGNGQIWVRIEKRKRRHLGRKGSIKKVQNHEYREKSQTRGRHTCNSHQPSQHWKWSQNGYEQYQAGRRGGKEKMTKSRYHTNRIKRRSSSKSNWETDSIHYKKYTTWKPWVKPSHTWFNKAH